VHVEERDERRLRHGDGDERDDCRAVSDPTAAHHAILHQGERDSTPNAGEIRRAFLAPGTWSPRKPWARGSLFAHARSGRGAGRRTRTRTPRRSRRSTSTAEELDLAFIDRPRRYPAEDREDVDDADQDVEAVVTGDDEEGARPRRLAEDEPFVQQPGCPDPDHSCTARRGKGRRRMPSDRAGPAACLRRPSAAAAQPRTFVRLVQTRMKVSAAVKRIPSSGSRAAARGGGPHRGCLPR